MPAFDALICLKEADTAILPHALESIWTHAKPSAIHIIASQSTIAQIQNPTHTYQLHCIDEDTLYEGLNLQCIQTILKQRINDTKRAGWYLQQFLKMAYASYKLNGGGRHIQNLHTATHYLIWDCDTILLKDVAFFDAHDNVLLEKQSEYHKPYFTTLERLQIPISEREIVHRAVDFSFIAEHMMIDSHLMQELITLIESTHHKPFWQAILDCVCDEDLGGSGFSEFETYGNFIACKYPHTLATITRKRDRSARQILGDTPTKEQLSWYSKYYDVCSIESWDTPTRLARWSAKYALLRCLPPKILKKLYWKLKRVRDALELA
ncbi:hypothetical protein [uncultured Helicobacter sp.]|uniref:hypothetical protein n=1 Tax=uncultured Helicobacter sp. TaxID=175537 RepID=UPI00374EFD06